MTKKNRKKDPLDLFPIPNDAIYINSKKNLNSKKSRLLYKKAQSKDGGNSVNNNIQAP